MTYLAPGLVKAEPQDSPLEADQVRAIPTGISQPLEQEAAGQPSFLDQVELGQSPPLTPLLQAQNQLLDIQSKTGQKPALIYAVFGYNTAHQRDQ